MSVAQSAECRYPCGIKNNSEAPGEGRHIPARGPGELGSCPGGAAVAAVELLSCP